MKQKLIFLFVFLILFLTISFAQKDTKIEKKLNKFFEKEQYEKCYETAFKLNKKYPKSFVPEYYISRVELKRYTLPNISENKKYKHLKNAVKYSYSLPKKYNDLKLGVKDSLKSHIYDRHDSTKVSYKCKNAIIYYTGKYKDTLDIYAYYFPELKKDKKTIQKTFLSKSDSLRNELVKFAEKQDGIKYFYTGEKPETGFDCSGFTMYVYNHIGIKLPHNAHMQSKLEGDNKTLEEAKPGDLIFFGSKNSTSYSTQHAGIIYSTEGEIIKVIHCVSRGVSIDGKNSSWENYWKDKVLFVKTIEILSHK